MTGLNMTGLNMTALKVPDTLRIFYLRNNSRMPGSMLILTWVGIIFVIILHRAEARCKILRGVKFWQIKTKGTKHDRPKHNRTKHDRPTSSKATYDWGRRNMTGQHRLRSPMTEEGETWQANIFTYYVLMKIFVLLSLGRNLCWWIISPRGYNQPSSRCFFTEMVY
jgi:hypothetical protein